MARFLTVKKLRALYPVDEAGEDVVRQFAQGEIIWVEVRHARNSRHHRLFFALMGLVWDNLDHVEYPTVDDLVIRVKIATGHRQRIEFEGGIVAYVPSSIAFSNMDQAEFSAFFDRVCDWVIATVLPGVTKDDLRQEIEIMTGIRDNDVV